MFNTITKSGLAVLAIAALTSSASFNNPLLAQNNTQRGAVTGGAAGAIIGGIIGNQNDETPEGILIGGAVGALAGGLLGNDRDQQIRNQQYHQQRQVVAWQHGVSNADVVALSQNGVGSGVIINHIRTHGVQQRIGVNEIIALSQQGVDSAVIDAMQSAPIAGTISQRPVTPVYKPAPVYRAPSIVVQPVRVPRPVYTYPRRGYHKPHHYHRGRHPSRGPSIHFNYRR